MKIADKINSAFFIAVALLMGVSMLIFYSEAKNNLEEAIFAHLNTTAQSRANHIETFLREDKVRIRLIAESNLIENFTEEITRNGPNSEELMQKASLILRDYAKQEEEAYELLVLNPDGKVIASTDEGHIGADESTDAHFLGGKDETYIRDAHHSESGETEYCVSTPIRDDNTKELLGVLVGRFRMTDLNKITTDRTGLGETGEIYLINKYGYMITPSRFLEDVFLKVKVDTENARNCLRPKDKDEHEHGAEGAFVFPDYRGVPVLGTHRYIEEMGWGLLAEIDEQEALAPLAAMKLTFTVIFCAGIGALWVVGILVSRAVTAPIHNLHRGAEIIGRGNLDYKVGTDAKDEIGQLSRAFDQMTEDLKETTTSIDELNKEIAEREKAEKELQKKMEELERFNRLAVGRELRMVELKREICELLRKLGREEKYKTDLDEVEICDNRSNAGVDNRQEQR